MALQWRSPMSARRLDPPAKAIRARSMAFAAAAFPSKTMPPQSPADGVATAEVKTTGLSTVPFATSAPFVVTSIIQPGFIFSVAPASTVSVVSGPAATPTGNSAVWVPSPRW